MKVLIDMNLSPDWVNVLEQNGLDVVHWKDIGDPQASDITIMSWARENDYVVFTRDLDFGTLLATTNEEGPSVIQVRVSDILPQNLGELLVKVIFMHQSDLESGVLITLTEDRVRLRSLPFNIEGN